MNELLTKEEINIENMIYEIRGKQVIFARDLAKLYEVETRVLMQTIKRNIERFPENFMFVLTREEFNIWKSQFVTSKNDKIGLRKLPYVFTEQGVAMLSGFLKSDKAIKTSISIINAFVVMRHYISSNLIEQKIINNIVLENQKKIKSIKNDIKLLQDTFKKFEGKRKDNEIYFEGQIYDAYSKIVDILRKAKNELVIIDGYADKTVLDIISNLKIPVTLICKTKSLLTKLDIEKYNSQYNNLTIKYDDTYHDRYFILDKKIIYHCGTSINHAGFKTFSINLLNDESITKPLINKVNII